MSKFQFYKKFKNHLKNNQGFTFIELVLTVLILGTGLFGLLATFQNVVVHGANSEEYVTAAYLTSSKMEEIIADKSSQGYDFVINANYNTSENLAGNFVGYTRTLNIFEVNSNDLITPQANTGYKRVVVSVVSPGGATVTYETLLTLWGVPLGL